MSRPRRPTLHVASCAAAFCLGLIGAISLAALSTRAASVEPGESKLGRMPRLDARIEALRSGAFGGRDALRLAVLGDSTVDAPEPIDNLPSRLHVELSRRSGRGPAVVVYSLAAPAMSSVTYHFLVGEIIEAAPDLVLWQVAFTHTSHHWRRVFTHHEVAGRMRVMDLVRLSLLPIHELGLSADDLLLYKLLTSAGLRTVWGRLVDEQSRVDKLRGALEARLASFVGVRPERTFRHRAAFKSKGNTLMRIDGRMRSMGEAAVDRHGAGLTGLDSSHVTLQLLAESLRQLEAAGIAAIVYLGPINVEHLRSIGVVDEAVLRESIEVYRDVVVSNGAAFVDLHDALPDASFVDARGHFHGTDEFDAVGRMIDKLLPTVTEEIERIDPRAMSGHTRANERIGR